MSISPTNIFLADDRFGAAYSERARQTLTPGPLARLLARLRAGALDRALGEGASPLASGQLAARAHLLTSRCTRSEVADGLEALLAAAHGPHRRWWALSRHDTVLAHGAELEELARVLRGPQPVYAGGVARLMGLLTDGTGPVYQDDPKGLARQLHDAHAALER